jgi:uncharacterized membrane protein
MVTQIIQALTEAVTGFATAIPEAMVSAFDSLFVVTAEGATTLTNLASGLLALAGIGIVIGCVVKIYHILSGRVRKSV